MGMELAEGWRLPRLKLKDNRAATGLNRRTLSENRPKGNGRVVLSHTGSAAVTCFCQTGPQYHGRGVSRGALFLDLYRLKPAGRLRPVCCLRHLPRGDVSGISAQIR